MKTIPQSFPLIVACCWLAALNAVSATVIYVSTQGTNTADGSFADPYDSVYQAVSAAYTRSGPVLIDIAPGEYSDSADLVIGRPALLLRGSGPDQTILADDVIVTAEQAFAELAFAGVLSNLADACMLHNVKATVDSIHGKQAVYGQWRDEYDYLHINSLADQTGEYDAVNYQTMMDHVDASIASYVDEADLVDESWVANYVATNGQLFVLKSGDTMSGTLNMDATYDIKAADETDLTISSGNPNQTGTAGDLVLQASGGNNGGSVLLEAGGASYVGDVTIRTDDGYQGGDILIETDDQGYDAGDVTISAGEAANDGGNVTIRSGGSSYGDDGDVSIYARGDGNVQIYAQGGGEVQISDVSTPTEADDAASKAYVDALIATNTATMSEIAGGLPDSCLIWVSASGASTNGDGSMENPYPTLSQPVITAAYGKTIVVCPGSYILTNDLTVNGTLTLKGLGAPDDVRLISANNGKRIFTVNSGSIIVENVTMTSTNMGSGCGFGGAVKGNWQSVFRNCRFIGCYNEDTSAGMGVGGAVISGRFEQCVFENCAAEFGGGVYAGIANETAFLRCRATQSGTGGGMNETIATRCTFEACDAHYGGGIADGTVLYSSLESCTGTYQGGALFNTKAYFCQIKNCYAQEGAALFNGEAQLCTISGSVAADGSAMYNADSYLCQLFNGTAEGGSQVALVTEGEMIFDGDQPYVKRTGDTMSGDLTITSGVLSVGITGSSVPFHVKEAQAANGVAKVEGLDGGTLSIDTFDRHVNIDNVGDGTTNAHYLFIGRAMQGSDTIVCIGKSGSGYQWGNTLNIPVGSSPGVGNVGVGVKQPAAKLHVGGDARVDGELDVYQVNVASNWVVGGASAPNQCIAVMNNAAGSVAWGAGTTKVVTHNLPFPDTDYLVLLTPTEDPGGRYYISAKATNSFTVTTTGSAFDFDYLIVKQ